jgi:hypothetical protein
MIMWLSRENMLASYVDMILLIGLNGGITYQRLIANIDFIPLP